MFASNLTDYDVVDATPFQAEPLKALADACRRHKIKLFFYYSLLDWHHPDYFPRGKTGQSTGRPAKGDWKRYVAYYQGQIRELCTTTARSAGSGSTAGGTGPTPTGTSPERTGSIHELQPAALIGNNHHVAPFAGEDFQIFEQDLPGENRRRFQPGRHRRQACRWRHA